MLCFHHFDPEYFVYQIFAKNDRLWRLIRPFQIGMLLPVVFGFHDDRI